MYTEETFDKNGSPRIDPFVELRVLVLLYIVYNFQIDPIDRTSSKEGGAHGKRIKTEVS